MIFGVCGGAAASLGIDVTLVRVAFLALTAVGGLGVALYVVAAAGMPIREDDPPRRPRSRLPGAIGATLVVACALAVLGGAGLILPGGLLGPLTLGGAGAALIWRRAGGEVRVGPGAPWITGGMRAVAGVLLVATGAALVVAQSGGIGPAAAAAISAGAVAAGIGLLVTPSLRRARAEAESERRERITAEERERVAGRLHDSVLQTLALIQREPDLERARALARRQDRELRAWLYGAEDVDAPQTLGGGLRAAVGDVEQAYGVVVQLVQPTDVAMEPPLQALVDATREAVTNAAKHAGVEEIDVLVQVTSAEARVFVRDRGAGFDPDAVPEDRRGLRDSIHARIDRAGGRVGIDTAPGAGTEIEIAVPRGSPA